MKTQSEIEDKLKEFRIKLADAKENLESTQFMDLIRVKIVSLEWVLNN